LGIFGLLIQGIQRPLFAHVRAASLTQILSRPARLLLATIRNTVTALKRSGAF
jgi:hypothetical protein